MEDSETEGYVAVGGSWLPWPSNALDGMRRSSNPRCSQERRERLKTHFRVEVLLKRNRPEVAVEEMAWIACALGPWPPVLQSISASVN